MTGAEWATVASTLIALLAGFWKMSGLTSKLETLIGTLIDNVKDIRDDLREQSIHVNDMADRLARLEGPKANRKYR